VEDASPEAAYRGRLEDRRARERRLRLGADRYAWARLAIGVAGAAVTWGVFGAKALPWPWLLAPVAAFVVVARLHDRALRAQALAERAASYYERALGRLCGRWAGEGTPGDEYLDPRHPYAADLDLFGRGSLFELLCAARTRAGERTLARWLLAPAAPDEVRARQRAVDELRGRLDLREDLAILGSEVRIGIDTESLLAWAEASPILEARWPVRVATVLAALDASALLSWLSGLTGPAPLLGAAALAGIFAWSLRRRSVRVLQAVGRPSRELRLLASILERLERERFSTPLLAGLREALEDRSGPPSRVVARLARIAEWNDSRSNQLFLPLAALVLLGTQLAFAVERWRREHGRSVRRWIEAVGDLEALGSLAAYAYEQPDDPFPEVVEEGPLFDAAGLGHPLVPRSRCVPNDARLGSELRLLLVSGSNMSGKSTLLRSVGINVVLALAGAPVRASRLVLSPLRTGACMRIQDSLQDGTSHFYAEILRLRDLMGLAKEGAPLLFLLDEVLHGTNSHDRRIGAEALIRGLLDRGAVGLVTTHDLALARIADDLAPAAANVHFEDRLEGDRIVFDYRLRPGVVQRSNALDLMRAVGLTIGVRS
jgi:hypothetical protein